jgi:UrcA family protein
MSIQLKSILTALALVAVCQSGLAAQPGNPIVTEHRSVYYGDLDLQADSGAQALLKRIRIAAIRVCGGAPNGPLVLSQYPRVRDCRAKAVENAVAKLNNPVVTAAYRRSLAKQEGNSLASR